MLIQYTCVIMVLIDPVLLSVTIIGSRRTYYGDMVSMFNYVPALHAYSMSFLVNNNLLHEYRWHHQFGFCTAFLLCGSSSLHKQPHSRPFFGL